MRLSHSTALDCFQQFGAATTDTSRSTHEDAGDNIAVGDPVDVVPSCIPWIDAQLPHSGIVCGTAFELHGDTGCGKTALVIDMCVNWLLSGLSVAYIDVDLKFSIDRLTRILDNSLRVLQSAGSHSGRTIQDYLSALEVFRCDSTCQEFLGAIVCWQIS